MRKNLNLYIILVLVCFAAYFLFLGSYPLLDVDETRYVLMAKQMFQTKDYMTLYLNGNFFFEKPPLFFWLECLSFKLFGNISELSARVPIVLLSLLPAGLLFYLSKKVKDIKFSFVNVMVLMTFLEYIFMTKMAILDSVLTSFSVSACFCYFLTFFVQEKNKKYFWISTYVLTGFAVLAKGIPGFVIPVGVIVISSILFKSYKETLKYLSCGIVLFLFITLPWHIIMLKTHNPLFFQEYIIKHHLQRFLGADVIHRNEPFYFYFVTLLWGLFPYTFTLLFKMFTCVKTFKAIELKDNYDKFFILNLVAVIVILLFFTSSKTKLVTYILPVYPFFAVLTGKIFYEFIEQGKHIAEVKNSVNLLYCMLGVSAFALCFAKLVVPSDIYVNLKIIQISLIILFTAFVCCNLVMMKKDNRLGIFVQIVVFMTLLSGFVTPLIYKFEYSLGQNDLMRFAKTAKEQNLTISTYRTGQRYSLLYYSGLEQIDFHKEDIGWLEKEIQKENNLLIVKNKDIASIPFCIKVAEKGTKFSVVEAVKNN